MHGGKITLLEEDVTTIRKFIDEADVIGTRYPEVFMQEMEGNCIPLSEWKA